MKPVSRAILSIVLLIEVIVPFQTKAAQTPTTLVPAGFENLATMGELVSIDLRLGGKSLGLFDARVTAHHLLFSDPQQILSRLPLKKGISDSDRESLLKKLKAPLLRHDDLACGFRGEEKAGCGYIDSNSIDMIYDEANEQATIFLRKSWLAAVQPDNPRWFTQSTDTSRGFVQQHTLTIAGSSGYRSASFDANAAMGITDKSFAVDDYSFLYNADALGSRTTLKVGNLYYRYDFGRKYYAQAGRMDARDLSTPTGGTFAFTMLPIDRVDGVRFGTTLAYINPESSSKRTPVTVLLSQNARVDAYRGAQLLSTNYFRPGIHTLDTSSFPSGSYLVTLRVLVNGREVRRESMPFSRTDGGSGVPGALQWFVEAGNAAPSGYAPLACGATILGGVKLSLANNLTLTSGIENRNALYYGEGALDWQHPFSAGTVDFSTALFAGSDGSRGNAENLSWTGPFSASLNWNDSTSSNGSLSHTLSHQQFLTASVSHPFFGSAVRAALTRSRSDWVYGSLVPETDDMEGSQDSFSRSPYFPTQSFHQVWIHQPSESSSLQLSLSQVFDWRNIDIDTDASMYVRQSNGCRDKGFYLSLRLHHSDPTRENEHAMNLDSALALGVENSQQGLQGEVGVSAYMTQHGALDKSANVGLNADNGGNVDAFASGRIAGRAGSASVGVSDHYEGRAGTQTPTFNGSYSGTLAVTSTGVLIGREVGGEQPLAAAIVSVKSSDAKSSQTVAEVSGSDTVAQDVKSGKGVLLPLAPYRQTAVDIEDPNVKHRGGVVSLKAGTGKRTWFLLPGHIAHQNATAQFTYTYVGRLIAGSKQSLGGGIILDGDFVALNDDGSFATDFHHRPKVLDVLSGKSLYECVMPSLSDKQMLFNVHTVHCTPVQSTAMPQYVLSNPQVIRILAQKQIKI